MLLMLIDFGLLCNLAGHVRVHHLGGFLYVTFPKGKALSSGNVTNAPQIATPCPCKVCLVVNRQFVGWLTVTNVENACKFPPRTRFLTDERRNFWK